MSAKFLSLRIIAAAIIVLLSSAKFSVANTTKNPDTEPQNEQKSAPQKEEEKIILPNKITPEKLETAPSESNKSQTEKPSSISTINIPSTITPCAATPIIFAEALPQKIGPNSNLRRKAGQAEIADGNFILLEGEIVDSFCTPIPNAVITMWQRDKKGFLFSDYIVAEKIEAPTSKPEPAEDTTAAEPTKESKTENPTAEEPTTEITKISPDENIADTQKNDAQKIAEEKKSLPAVTYEASPQMTAPEDAKPDRFFAYSGRTTTDNAGRFRFLSIMPGAAKPYAPAIFIQVHHKDFPLFSSRFVFANHPLNENDPLLKTTPPSVEKALSLSGFPISVNNPTLGRRYPLRIVLDGKVSFERF